MNKAIVGIIIVIVLGVGGWAVLGRDKAKTDNTTAGSSSKDTSMPTSNDQSQATPAATSSVTIQSFAFSPANITIKKGATVTWTNQDSAPHTVKETDSLTGPDSDNLAKGKTYSFTFDTVGTYHYRCSIHPQMTGTVTVTE